MTAARRPIERLLSALVGRITKTIWARTLVFCLIVLTCVQVASFMALRSTLVHHAQKGLPTQLRVGEEVLQGLLEQSAKAITERGRLMADDPALRTALVARDSAAITTLLEFHSARLGVTESALLTPEFGLRALSGIDAEKFRPVVERLAARAAGGGVINQIALLGGYPHQVAQVPIRAAEPSAALLGWLLVGIPIDRHLGATMERLTALKTTLLTRSNDRPAWSPILSSLADNQARELARETWSATTTDIGAAPDSAGTAATSAPRPMRSVQLGRETVGVAAHWLMPASQAGPRWPPGLDPDGDALLALLSLSLDALSSPPGDLERAARRGDVEIDLHRALLDHQLFVVYQPVVSLQGDAGFEGLRGRGVDIEALVRWRHPTRGVVPPTEFIGVAEECGLIGALGKFVLETACHQFVDWQQTLGQRAPGMLAVNLSRGQLSDPGLVEFVRETLRSSRMQAHHLQLEVTESLAAQDELVQTRLRELKDLGLSLALDDFGTGYSSLSNLHQLPVTTVKIDRSFVSEAVTSAHHRVLIEATVRVADSLNMDTVAEGIETEAQAALVRSLGCKKAQGYFFSGLLLASDLAQWVTSEKFFRVPAQQTR